MLKINLKKEILDFSIRHKKEILKFVPLKVIVFCEGVIVNNKLNKFERTTKIDAKLKDGINLVGYLKTQSGLGEGARIIGRALRLSKYKTSLIDTRIDSRLDSSGKYDDVEFDKYLSKDFLYNINLFHCQPHTSFEVMLSAISIENLKGRYNIGFWLFELEDIPEKWFATFKYVNEIWTPSTFVTDAFKKVSPVPVYTIPYGISAKKNEKLKRKDFGIPDDKFTYLIMFDSNSSSRRKNPIGSIEAFVKAFANNEDVCLVVKVNAATEEDLAMLKEKLKKVKHYRFINEILSKEDVNSLISLCDVFVSLHRSEGFGLVMAEAMMLGTVCIATNYSANTDFMNKYNSCLVDYKLIYIENDNSKLYADNQLYTKDNKWADPDLKQASEYMLKLFNDKKLYNKLKKNAKETIEKEFNLAKTTKAIEKRIDEIKKEMVEE